MQVKDNQLSTITFYIKEKLAKHYSPQAVQRLTYLTITAATGLSKLKAITQPEQKLNESEILEILKILKRLLQHEPIEYILQTAEFYDLTLTVNPNVLIPRPETEELVKIIIQDYNLRSGLNVIDIGTGSGAIILALTKHLVNANAYALDISQAALDVAVTNAEKYKLPIKFIKANILDNNLNLNCKFDIIVSNPPYVLETEAKEMHKNVLDYEPKHAIFVPETDPLLFYKAIVSFAKHHLKIGGRLYFEINHKFANDIFQLLTSQKFTMVEVLKDFNDKSRFVKSTYKGGN